MAAPTSKSAYSEKLAELDHGINIRPFRKLVELEKRLDAMLALFDQVNRSKIME